MRVGDPRPDALPHLTRRDFILSPKHEGIVPLVIELKRVRSDEELDEGLDDAIRQIHWMRYYSGMPGKVILIRPYMTVIRINSYEFSLLRLR